MQVVRILKKFSTILNKHQKVRLVQLLGLMIIGGFLEMMSVSLVLPFMNAVMDPQGSMDSAVSKVYCGILGIHTPRAYFISLSIILAVVYIVKNAYLILEYHIQCRFVYGNMFLMQKDILCTLLNRPYEFFLHVKSGEIVRLVNSDTPCSFRLLSSLLTLFTEIVVSITLIITVFFIMPSITLMITTVLVVLIVAINRYLKPILHNAGRKNQEANAAMNKWLLQAIQGIKEIKIAGKEEFFQKNYNANGRVYVQMIRRGDVLALLPRYLIEAILMSGMFAAITVMMVAGVAFESIIPMLTAIAMAAMRLLPSMNRISGMLTNISYNEPMLDELLRNLDGIHSSSVDANFHIDCSVNITHLPFENQITLSNVEYRYPGSDNEVFHHASMVIHKGESVGIVGVSGSGKTTAIDLLLGLLKPQNGNIFVDQMSIFQDIRAWHSQIGYIPQMIFMLDDTIRANVALGEQDKDINDREVWRALEEASLGGFVKSLPEGILTHVGERGVRLSGGQKQRIGIARALYNNPQVLVFDEATSALDTTTESEIMESISKLRGEKTLIIIAHRLSTLEGCDVVFRVENGKIVKEE